MHVCCGELEGVLEALGFDFALFADGSCCADVADVFVVLGEHEVGEVFAVGVLLPVGVVFFVFHCFVCIVV